MIFQCVALCTTCKLGRDSPLFPVHVVPVPESRKSPVEKDKPVAALTASIFHFMIFDAFFQQLIRSQILHGGSSRNSSASTSKEMSVLAKVMPAKTEDNQSTLQHGGPHSGEPAFPSPRHWPNRTKAWFGQLLKDLQNSARNHATPPWPEKVLRS